VEEEKFGCVSELVIGGRSWGWRRFEYGGPRQLFIAGVKQCRVGSAGVQGFPVPPKHSAQEENASTQSLCPYQRFLNISFLQICLFIF
jgi:hypothetical protein